VPLREEHKIRVFENTVVRKIFRTQDYEEQGERGVENIHNEEF